MKIEITIKADSPHAADSLICKVARQIAGGSTAGNSGLKGGPNGYAYIVLSDDELTSHERLVNLEQAEAKE